ncbi:hypothetical protein FOZ62_001325, partial [Perkinsus olseni]
TTTGSDYALTTPRKELHALYQACKEAYSLYSSCNLAPSMGSRITVLTDSLINLQRLQWIGSKNEEEVLSGLRRRHMTIHDVDKLLSIRELLLRVTLPIKVVHIPSEVNLADPGSRCKPHGPDGTVLKLLASILDSPNQRPTYVPVSLSTTTSGEEEDLPAGSHLCPLSPRAGPLPVPLPEDPSQQVPRLSDEDTQALDSLINESVKQDRTFEAIRLFLSSGTVSPPFSRERLRRASAQYEVDQNGTLYRTVLQRADGSIVKQRVVGEDRALLLKLVGSTHINHHHLGARQLMLKVKEEYHFKNLPSVVRRCVRLCRPCSRANAVRKFNSSAGAHNVQDLKPLQVIGVDIYLPNLKDPSEKVYQKEYSGCLVVTCLATSFQRVHLLKGSVTTKSVCEGLTLLFNNSIWPSVLVSDSASCFSSKEMLRWCKLRGLVHLFSPPHAAALSRWERSHREITRCLRCCACDTHFFGGKPWFDIVSDVVSNLNHLPYSEDCWITPAMLCFGFFDPGDFYRPTDSLDQLAERLVANESRSAVQRQREQAQSNYKLRMVDYFRHWTAYRERSRARVLSAHGRPCDLKKGDLVYHLVDSPKAKLSSRVLGPFTVTEIESGKATAVLSGFNGSSSRAWVSNLIRVPKDDVFSSHPASTPSSSTEESSEHFQDFLDGDKEGSSSSSSPPTRSSTSKDKPLVSLKPYEWSLDNFPPFVVLPPPPR